MQFESLYSPGYLTTTIPPDLLAELREACENFDQLTGLRGWTTESADRRVWPISTEWSNWLVSLANDYANRAMLIDPNSLAARQGLTLGNQTAWINRLNPGDSTPLHTHDSVISWTAWPYTHPEPLQINWVNTLGWPEVVQIPAESGVLVMWPSRLSHTVNTVTAVRWSAAGNIRQC